MPDMRVLLKKRQQSSSSEGGGGESSNNGGEAGGQQQEQEQVGGQQAGDGSSSSNGNTQDTSSADQGSGDTGSQGETSSSSSGQGNNSNNSGNSDSSSSGDNTGSDTTGDNSAATGTGSQSDSGNNQQDSDTSRSQPTQTSEDNYTPSSTYIPDTSTVEDTTTTPTTSMDQSPSTSEGDNTIPSETSSTGPTTSPTEDNDTTSQPESTSTSTSEDTSSTSETTITSSSDIVTSETSTTSPTDGSTTSETSATDEPTTSTSEPADPTTSSSSSSSTLEPESSTATPTTSISPVVNEQITTTSTTSNNIAQSASSIFLSSSSSSLDSLLASSSAAIAVVSATQDPLVSLASSSSSSSAVALGDQLAPTSEIDASPSSSSPSDGGNDDGNGDGSGAGGTSTSKDPFLNGAGDGMGQNGKVIGGTVGGIIAAIVIVVVVVWFIGKHRRRKFVKPVVERLHASGSGYSLPSMFNTPGSNSGSASNPNSARMTPSTSLQSTSQLLMAATSSKRRSRAFSIESASTYDKVDLNTEAGGLTPIRGRHAELMSQVRPFNDTGEDVGQNRRMGDEEEALVLPVGAAPYPYRALHGLNRYGQGNDDPSSSYNAYGSYGVDQYNPASMTDSHHRMGPTRHHQQIPSGSSFGSQYNEDTGSAGQQGYGYAQAGPSSQPSNAQSALNASNRQSFYQNAQNASPTKELLIPPSIFTSGFGNARSPFDDDADGDGNGQGRDPMPHSPTLVPTQLSRRTTDPFSNKHSLRVVNPDDASNRECESPTTPVATTSTASTTMPAAAISRPRAATQSHNTTGAKHQQEDGRPFSNWSSLAPSRASTSTMSDAYSTFHFDSSMGLTDNNGRYSRADSLDANRRLMRVGDDHQYPQSRSDTYSRLELRRASSALEFVTPEGDILTPRQVNDVGFFRDA